MSVETTSPGALDSTPVIPMILNGNVTSSLNGISKSMLSRARALTDLGWHPVVLVHTFHAAAEKEVAKLEDLGYSNSEIEIRNMYVSLRRMRRTNVPVGVSRPRFSRQDYGQGERDATNPNIERFYEDGRYLAHVNWGDGSYVPVVTEFTEGNRTAILWLDDDGWVIRRRLFNASGVPVRDEYFGDDGTRFLTVGLDGDREVSFTLLDDECNELRFKDHDHLLQYWLGSCCADVLRGNLLISEWAFQMKVIDELKNELEFRTIYVFHGTHILSQGPRYREQLDPLYRDVVENIGSMDACVVLTDQQAMDLRKWNYRFDNIAVIPHYFEPPATMSVVRDRRRVCSISQLRPVKGVAEFVPFFKRVVEKVEGDAPHFEIFGYGPEEQKIRDEIAEAGLSEYVTLRGRTADPLAEYARSAVAVFPSAREGQPLSLFEAMSVGAVPVAFDFKYGARAGISDGVNGFVVDMFNYVEMADCVALLLNDDHLREQMSAVSRTRATEYTKDEFASRWANLLRDVMARPVRGLDQK